MSLPVSPAELRLHIERIVEHPEFGDSPRHRHLLRYLADHAIASGGQSVPPRSIEVDVLARSAGGRGRSLTPPTVMVADLRRKLERYAAGAGRGDAIRITIAANDCRLEATRTPAAEASVAAPVPRSSAGPRSAVLVVEFDAEPMVRHLARPLAEAIGERLRDTFVRSVQVLSRPEIAAMGLAIEHAVAAREADAGVHGMLLALPSGRPDYTSIGASVRLIALDGSVVWTLWCEEQVTPAGAEDALRLMAAKVSQFVVDGDPVVRTPAD